MPSDLEITGPTCLPFLRPFPPFIHCFPRIKIKESYWLGSSGREVRGKGTEGRKGRMSDQPLLPTNAIENLMILFYGMFLWFLCFYKGKRT